MREQTERELSAAAYFAEKAFDKFRFDGETNDILAMIAYAEHYLLKAKSAVVEERINNPRETSPTQATP